MEFGASIFFTDYSGHYVPEEAPDETLRSDNARDVHSVTWGDR